MIHNMREGIKTLKPFLDWLPLSDANVLEVGTFGGAGAVEFLQCDKVQSLTCVDPFIGGYDPDGDIASRSDMDEVCCEWIRNIRKHRHGKQVTLRIGVSWPDDNYQLIYLDANHTYETVRLDIEWAMDSFRPTILAGHDYTEPAHPGVKKAVDECFKDIKLFPDSSWAVVL